jgi:hypothetical protein
LIVSFKFDLNQLVTLSDSGEKGKVIGRAQYVPDHSPQPQYQVRYINNAGVLTEQWWSESQLQAV